MTRKVSYAEQIDHCYKRLQAAKAEWKAATDEAAQVARDAYEDGFSEVALAKGLGVDRARTLRRWLGKN